MPSRHYPAIDYFAAADNGGGGARGDGDRLRPAALPPPTPSSGPAQSIQRRTRRRFGAVASAILLSMSAHYSTTLGWELGHK